MYRWYHANLDNKNAEKLLMERGVDGSYLVRPSKSCAGHFSLSVRRKDTVTHIKIRRTGDFYDLHGGEQFATLNELVQYYAENQLKEKNGEVFELKKPLNSSDLITERWFHGSINGAVAEKMIRDNGVNGSFLVRESQSRIGNYVLTVRIKDDQNDKVTHVVIRHHNNKYDVGGGEKFDTLTELVEHYKRNPMVETKGSVINMKYPFNATRITASDIDARIKELSKNNSQFNDKDGFWEEFEHLQHQECKVFFNRKIGQEDRNMSKNRYKNILPFDYTRVILKRKQFSFMYDDNFTHRSSLSADGDYINANYIKLVDDEMHISDKSKPVPHSKVYIATQGPLPNSVNDFWWMVWQERSECIIMVTKEMERDKNKCCRYWPILEQKMLVAGPLEVRILADSSSDKTCDRDYICREFEIRHISAGENIHRVTQYQYLAWPDLSIPSSPSGVLNFLTDINRRPPSKGPMVVHCSAGIGRSGTLIVIDMLMDQLRCHGLNYDIDIQRIVKTVRAQRSGLVQTEAQYKFIYLAVQSYINLIG